MTLTHAPLFVGLLMLLHFALGLNTSWLRKRTRILKYGDTSNPRVFAAERAHGNNVEHAMAMSIMLIALELMGAPKLAIAWLGAGCVLARLLRTGGFLLRVRPMGFGGVVLTYTCEAALSIWLVRAGARAMLLF